MDYNINLNQKTLEACLKPINNIGGTTYQNICTGQSSYVPWGASDWVGGLFIAGLIVGAVFMVIVTTKIFWSDL